MTLRVFFQEGLKTQNSDDKCLTKSDPGIELNSRRVFIQGQKHYLSKLSIKSLTQWQKQTLIAYPYHRWLIRLFEKSLDSPLTYQPSTTLKDSDIFQNATLKVCLEVDFLCLNKLILGFDWFRCFFLGWAHL